MMPPPLPPAMFEISMVEESDRWLLNAIGENAKTPPPSPSLSQPSILMSPSATHEANQKNIFKGTKHHKTS
jgi:hypothetical protein